MQSCVDRAAEAAVTVKGIDCVTTEASRPAMASARLVIVSPGQNLLAGRPQDERVLELSRVAALDVAERRVLIDDASVTQVPQGHQVLSLAESVEPTAAECKRAEVVVDHAQQLLGPGHPDGTGGASARETDVKPSISPSVQH